MMEIRILALFIAASLLGCDVPEASLPGDDGCPMYNDHYYRFQKLSNETVTALQDENMRLWVQNRRLQEKLKVFKKANDDSQEEDGECYTRSGDPGEYEYAECPIREERHSEPNTLAADLELKHCSCDSATYCLTDEDVMNLNIKLSEGR